jgi:L-fuculose-phosphate aldolase
METERRRVVEYGRRMVESGLTAGAGGNLSVRDPASGLVALSPSGMAYAEVEPEDVVLLDLEGRVVEGHRAPSSELAFHLALYRARPDAGAVVHTHSVYATTLACLGWELPAVHYLVGYAGTKVPLAPYATYGTEELARAVVETLGDDHAVLLANHGLVAVGPTMARAFTTAEMVELVARIYLQAKGVGEPVVLNDDQMAEVLEKFGSYGQN